MKLATLSPPADPLTVESTERGARDEAVVVWRGASVVMPIASAGFLRFVLLLCTASSLVRAEADDIRELCCTPDADGRCRDIRHFKSPTCSTMKTNAECHTARIGTRPCVWDGKGKKCLKGWTASLGHEPECPGPSLEVRRVLLPPLPQPAPVPAPRPAIAEKSPAEHSTWKPFWSGASMLNANSRPAVISRPVVISSPSLMNSLTGTVRYVKLYGERHSGTTDIENKLVKPRLRVIDSWLEAGPLEAMTTGAGVYSPDLYEWGVHDQDAYFRLTFRQNLGWKHGEPPTPQELEAGSGPSCNDTLFLVTTRHPLDWVASLYKRTYVRGWQPKSRGQTLRDFVRAPAPCVPRANRDGDLSASVGCGCIAVSWS